MASAAECAVFIDLSERRFREMLDQGIFKRSPRGQYDLKTVVITYVRRLRAEAAGRADSSAGLTQERTRLAHAVANKAERRDRIEQGRLVDVDAVAKLVDVERSVVRERMLSMGGELQGSLNMIPGADAALVVDSKARDILLELSEPNALVRRAAREAAGLGDLHG
jgi:hypothetical protein